jgi:ATP-binding cassette, subfamily B, multidrug efflux pump
MLDAVRFLRPYLGRHRQQLLLGLGALILNALFGATLPLMIRRGIDSITAGEPWSATALIAGGLLLLALGKGLFQYWKRLIIIGVSRDLEYDLRNDILAHLVVVNRNFYAQFPTGDIMARSTNDLNAVRMMAGPGLMYWSETMLTFFLAFCVMVTVDPVLTLAALAPAPIISILVVYYGQRIHARFEEIQRVFSTISGRVQESVAGMRLLRAYGQGEAERVRFEELNQDYIRRNLDLVRTTGVFEPLLHALSGIAFLVVLWVGGLRVLDGKISLGSFVMFQTYVGMLIWPMIAMGWVINLMQRGTASLSRIREMLNVPPTIATPADPTPVPVPLAGGIVFADVRLEYAAGPALSGVSFTVAAGETVAVVGPTGSGKTSLTQMVPRLLDPTAGAVWVDGVDVRDYDPELLRRQISIVPQETFLFSMSLRDNIALGSPRADDAAIERAVEIAGLTADVAGFPDGLATMIGERGITLSGGQRQRTAIARAILRDPRILILDDALSSVDTVTEAEILERLGTVMKGRTTLLISHRVSTMRYADRIVVLKQGEIAEIGTSEALLARHGYYASLVRKQQLEEEIDSL